MAIKVVMVGPEESKWKPEQIPKVKEEIGRIFVTELWKFNAQQISPQRDYTGIILVSGHCPKGGVNIWAEEIADELGIEKEIYPAEVNRWNDDISHQIEIGFGYKPENPPEVRLKGCRSRNIQIAEACDVLYCIVPKVYVHPDFIKDAEEMHAFKGSKRTIYCIHCNQFGHPSNGGCWTMKYAKKLGKETHLVVIE